MDLKEKSLLQEASKGDINALNQIVEEHKGMVYGTCLRILKNKSDAEDATQATFLIFFKKCKKLRDGTVLGGWLYNAARLIAKEHIRALSRRKRHEEEASIMQNILHEKNEKIWEELKPELDNALISLPKPYRDILVLRYLEGRTTAETATTMEISESLVTTRLARSIEKLRRCFRRRGIIVSTTILSLALAENAAANTVPVTLGPSVLAALENVVVNGTAIGAVSTNVYLMIKGGLAKMFWSKVKLIGTATAIVLSSIFGVHSVLMNDLPETLGISEEGKEKINTISQVFSEKYFALEKKHTQIHQDEANHIQLTIDVFPDELKELKEAFWHELDQVLDKRQQVVARRYISMEKFFPYGEIKHNIDISYQDKRFIVKDNSTSYAGEELPVEFERFWGKKQTPLSKSSFTTITREYPPAEECLDFRSGKPELTTNFIQTLNLAPKQVEKSNEILQKVFQDYLAIEKKRIGNKKIDDNGNTIQISVLPFRKDLESLKKGMWSELGNVLDKEQLKVIKELLPLTPHNDLFAYGDMTYSVEIRQEKDSIYKRVKYSAESFWSNANGCGSYIELPDKYRRLLDK